MESVLKQNIEAQMRVRGLKKLAELQRLTKVHYRTLQDVMTEKSTARITTVGKIAAGLGIPPGQLLEDPGLSMVEAPKKEQNLRDLLSALASLNDAQIGHLLTQANAMLSADKPLRPDRLEPEKKGHKPA